MQLNLFLTYCHSSRHQYRNQILKAFFNGRLLKAFSWNSSAPTTHIYTITCIYIHSATLEVRSLHCAQLKYVLRPIPNNCTYKISTFW